MSCAHEKWLNKAKAKIEPLAVLMSGCDAMKREASVYYKLSHAVLRVVNLIEKLAGPTKDLIQATIIIVLKVRHCCTLVLEG